MKSKLLWILCWGEHSSPRVLTRCSSATHALPLTRLGQVRPSVARSSCSHRPFASTCCRSWIVGNLKPIHLSEKSAFRGVDVVEFFNSTGWALYGKNERKAFVNTGRLALVTPDPVTPDHYSGALMEHCIPAVLPFWGKTGMQAMNNGANALTPVNAILSGTANNKSLPFNIDKSITGTCPITAATVTPFGTQQLALEWKDGCGDGDMILFR